MDGLMNKNKDNIKQTFSAIHPTDECMERIMSVTNSNKKRIKFTPVIALVACLAIVVTGVVGYNAAYSHLAAGGVEDNAFVEVPDKVFTITAYAGEGDSKKATVLNTDNIVLADYKLSWEVGMNGAVSLHGGGETEFSVAGKNIKSVTYSCKSGYIGFVVDVNRVQYLKIKGEYFDVILPYLDEFKNDNGEDWMEIFREHFSAGEYDKYFTNVEKKGVDDYYHAEEIYSDDDGEIIGIGIVSNEVWSTVFDEGELKEHTFENYFSSSDSFASVMWSPNNEVLDGLVKNNIKSFVEIPHDTITISVEFNNGSTQSISYDIGFNKNGNMVLEKIQ